MNKSSFIIGLIELGLTVKQNTANTGTTYIKIKKGESYFKEIRISDHLSLIKNVDFYIDKYNMTYTKVLSIIKHDIKKINKKRVSGMK